MRSNVFKTTVMRPTHEPITASGHKATMARNEPAYTAGPHMMHLPNRPSNIGHLDCIHNLDAKLGPEFTGLEQQFYVDVDISRGSA
jgi:hypothetical protein